jgi:hypothetical protein
LNADYYSLSVLAPYYGTQIYKDLEKEDSLVKDRHWEYFFHQREDMLVNRNIDKDIITEFLNLNAYSKGSRV